jgi:hypothetical protein
MIAADSVAERLAMIGLGHGLGHGHDQKAHSSNAALQLRRTEGMPQFWNVRIQGYDADRRQHPIEFSATLSNSWCREVPVREVRVDGRQGSRERAANSCVTEGLVPTPWLLALCLFASGCGVEPMAGGHDAAATTPAPALNLNLTSGADCVPGEPLDYESFGRDFMARYCLSCHTRVNTGTRMAPLGRDFDDLALIRQFARQIDQMAAAGPAANTRVMPPSEPKPSPLEREQLGRWLACGAPARASDVAGAAAPAPPTAGAASPVPLPATAGTPAQ